MLPGTRKSYPKEVGQTFAFVVACDHTEMSGRAKRGFCVAKLLTGKVEVCMSDGTYIPPFPALIAGHMCCLMI